MSSHHFVKDGQEPALLLVSPENCAEGIVDGLLEWQPKVLAMAAAVPWALANKVKLDTVLCDQASLALLKAATAHQHPIGFAVIEPYGLLAALQWWESQGGAEVNVCGKPVHEQWPQGGFNLPVTVYGDNGKSVFCRQGLFSKWAAKGTEFRVYSQWKIHTEGAKRLSDSRFVAIQDGHVRFSSPESFWLTELLGYT